MAGCLRKTSEFHSTGCLKSEGNLDLNSVWNFVDLTGGIENFAMSV